MNTIWPLEALERITIQRNKYCDLYPKLQRGVRASQRLNPPVSIVDNYKSLFWEYIAKKHESFKPFIIQTSKNVTYKSPFFDALNNSSFVQINNFLSEDEFIQLEEEIKAKVTKSNCLSDYFYLSENAHNIFNSKTSDIQQDFFGCLATPHLLLHHIKSNNDVLNPSDKHVHAWHCDRYIPCLKGIYFPEGCNAYPFQIVQIKSSTFFDIIPLKERKRFCIELPSKLKSFPIYTSYVPPNTLILTLNHIFHRRSFAKLEPKANHRTSIFLDWWTSFNYYKLLNSMINGLK